MEQTLDTLFLTVGVRRTLVVNTKHRPI